MGEIADMMLDGCLCQYCGKSMGDGDGIAVVCEGCQAYHGVDAFGESRVKSRPRSVEHPNRSPKPVGCAACTRRFWSHEAMVQHQRAKHPMGVASADHLTEPEREYERE